MSFGAVVSNTLCPFAHLATWREWRLELPTRPDDALRALSEYGNDIRQQIPFFHGQEIDMLALEIDHPQLVGSLEPFTASVRSFIQGLHAEESYANGELGSGEKDWLLVIDGIRLFGLTFAPFYEPDHPRHSPNGSAYIVLQFLFSFHKIGLHRMTMDAKRRLSDRVRASFEESGAPYFPHITNMDAPEVLKMIKPLRAGDPAVRWWRDA